MNLIYWILLSCGLSAIFLISCPIVIRVKSKWVCTILWTVIRLEIVISEGQSHFDLYILKLRFPLKEKKKSAKKTKSPVKQKAKKKLPFNSLKEVLFDQVVTRLIKLIIRFCLRLVKAIKIRVVRANIGLNDYYSQGILTGCLSSLPRSRNFQIIGNFEEVNDIDLHLRISLWRILWAVMLLVLRFPYYRTIKLLLKVRRDMVLVENT
jgi:hypothetical protein